MTPRSGAHSLSRRAVLCGLGAAAAPAAAAEREVSGDFDGGRPTPFDPAAKNKGRQLYRARSGQTYRRIVATNFGNGLVRVSQDVDGLKLESIEARNFYRLLEGDPGVTLSNFVVRDIRANGFERSVARLRGRSNNGLFQDIRADSEAQIGDPFAVGFHFDEGCHDITVERCSVFRCQTPAVADKYRQGDGFSDEAGCSNIRYVDTLAQECTDGGYDLKSKGLTMIRARAVSNKRNFRLWADNRLAHIISESPTESHLSTHGGRPVSIHIERLEIHASRPTPLFLFEASKGTRLSIGSYDLHVPPGTPIMRNRAAGSEIDWGPQGPPRGLTPLMAPRKRD